MAQATGVDLRPFVRFMPPDAGGEAGDQDAQEPPDERVFENETALAAHVRKAWERNKLARTRITQRLLKCLHARRGVYSAQELDQLAQRGAMNVVWVDLTEEKCKAAAAWLREVLMPVSDFPFDTEPTPVPDLPQEVRVSILERAAANMAEKMSAAAASGAAPPSIEEFRESVLRAAEEMDKTVRAEIDRRAREAAKRMRKRIADTMAEGGWDDAMDAFIEDLVTYPAAVLHGPTYKHSRSLKWGPGGAVGVEEKSQQSWEWIDIFDVYPDPNARDCQTGDFIVRRRYTSADLFDCIDMPGYNGEQIRAALRDYSEGHLEGWIWQEAERRKLQAETLYSFLSPRARLTRSSISAPFLAGSSGRGSRWTWTASRTSANTRSR